MEDVKGHALTLNLLGAYLHDAHAGDIRKRDLVELEEADADEQGGHAFRVMDAYVRWFESEGEKGKRALAMLRLLGLFDRVATSDCLAALLKAPAIMSLTEALVGISEAQRNMTFTRLEAAQLLTINRDTAGTLLSMDAHPLVREYFALQHRTRHPEAWRAAHRRLYEHLCATTPDQSQPTLEDFQPLYQAVAHGCQAGMAQQALDSVYIARIVRGTKSDGFYSTRNLGAFGSELGAIACFFDQPWFRLSPALTEADKAWLLNAAAYCLRALGRLGEALEPMRAALKNYAKREDWRHAARVASNLGELELTMGAVVAAVEDAEVSVSYADRSDDDYSQFMQVVCRTIHADALHQAGCRAEAEVRFREAEELRAKGPPEYQPQLLGFHHCELLLTAPERAAWKDVNTIFSHQAATSCAAQDARASQMQSCRLVFQRVREISEWRARRSLLGIALDNLILGRAGLYAAILAGSSLDPCNSFLQHAVDGLRRAGQLDEIPRGLLTRAWFRFLSGARTGPGSAQNDLDEAWDTAERGPMPLFLADIHLYRARLFFRVTPYPWDNGINGAPRGPKDDLASARRLIEKHGYRRRKEELEDAEQALGVHCGSG